MATAAAAVIAKTRRNVVSHFLSQNAVSPDKAVAYEPSRRLQRRLFEQFKDAGVVRPGVRGGYYLDAPAWDRFSRQRRRRAGALIAGALAVTGAAVALLG